MAVTLKALPPATALRLKAKLVGELKAAARQTTPAIFVSTCMLGGHVQLAAEQVADEAMYHFDTFLAAHFDVLAVQSVISQADDESEAQCGL